MKKLMKNLRKRIVNTTNKTVQPESPELQALISEYSLDVSAVRSGRTTKEVEPVRWLNVHKVADEDLRIGFLTKTQNLDFGIL